MSDVELHVRAARRGDERALVGVVHAAFAEYEGRLDPPSGAHSETVETVARRIDQGALVAEASSDPVGCLFYEEQADELYLGRVAVLPSWRGRGVGRRLIDAALEVGRQRGLAAATLGVRLRLTRNIGLFHSLGFRPYDVGTHNGCRYPTFLRMRRLLP